MLKVLDLFSGIGGFSLGLERTGGFKTVAFCEIDEKARRVLRKHWPTVPIFNDVTYLTGHVITEAVPGGIDIVTGGFPCQDISLAGKGAGLAGERSGLWYEFHRIIKETRPKYAIIENVAALRSRGLDAILWGLAEIGYDAEWHCIPASAVGAPHRRDRIWILAYPAHKLGQGVGEISCGQPHRPADGCEAVADAGSSRLEGEWLRTSGSSPQQPVSTSSGGIIGKFTRSQPWIVEPGLGGASHGLSVEVDRPQLITGGWRDGWEGTTPRLAVKQLNRQERIRQLGNAVVPQIPELIGRAILAHENNSFQIPH